MARVSHKDLTTSDLHAPGYVQTSDPGATGASIQWIDTSAGAGKWLNKIRKSDNSGWESLQYFPAVDIDGGTIDGAVIGGTTPAAGSFTSLSATLSSGGLISADGPAATSRGVDLKTDGLLRWNIRTSTTAETGGNAGSNFAINRYKDDGTYLGTPINIARDTGIITQNGSTNIGADLAIGGALDHNGSTVGFYGATPVARQTYGAPTGTATRTTFATDSVTLPQLAERVKALIDDLRSVGLMA